MPILSHSPVANEFSFGHAQCGFLILDMEGTILRVNEIVLTWTDCSLEQIKQKTLGDITPPGTHLYFKLLVFPLIRLQGYVNEIKLDVLLPNGGVKSCLLNASAQSDSDGVIRQVDVILFPIADRKKYEEEILLQKNIAETISYEREQILSAQRRIMSILGHDTRAPLVSMNNLLKLVAQGKMGTEEVRPYFGMMSSQLDAILVLIASLLDWANAHFDTERMEQIPVTLFTLVDDVCALLEAAALVKGLALKTRLAPTLVVTSQQSIISFIIRNLVNNAIKFTGQGSITISAIQDQEGVHISVTDTGIGMSPEQSRQYLAGNLSSSVGTSNELGSGMGLMLIKQYLIQLRGSIAVESNQNQGSAITISLPNALFGVEGSDDQALPG